MDTPLNVQDSVVDPGNITDSGNIANLIAQLAAQIALSSEESKVSFKKIDEHIKSLNENQTTFNASQMTLSEDIKRLHEQQATLTSSFNSEVNRLETSINRTKNELMLEIKKHNVEAKGYCDVKIHNIDKKLLNANEAHKTYVKQSLLLAEGGYNLEMSKKIELVEMKCLHKIADAIKPVSAKIDEVESLTATQGFNGGNTVIRGMMPKGGEIQLPKFYPNKQSPVRHVKELDDYMHIYAVPSLHKLKLAAQSVQGSAKQWFKAFEHTFENYDMFKQHFLSKYHSDTVQQELKDKIVKGFYNPKNNESLTEHFINTVVQNKELDVPLTELELIGTVTRHFDLYTQQMLLSRNATDIVSFQNVLENIDTLYRSSRAKDESRRSRCDDLEVTQDSPSLEKNENSVQSTVKNNDEKKRKPKKVDNYKETPSARLCEIYAKPQRAMEFKRRKKNTKDLNNMYVSNIEKLESKEDFDWLEDPREFLMAEKDWYEPDIISGPTKVVKIHEIEFESLFDTGSNISAVSCDALARLQEKHKVPVFTGRAIKVQCATRDIFSKCNTQALLPIDIDGKLYEVPCFVLKGLQPEVVFGGHFLRKHGVVISYTDGKIKITFSPAINEKGAAAQVSTTTPVELSMCSMTVHNTQKRLNTIVSNCSNNSKAPICDKQCDELKAISESDVDELINSHVDSITHLNRAQKESLKDVLLKHKFVFSKKPGKLEGVEHRINLQDYSPIKCKTYPIAEKHKDAVDEQIQRLLKWGIIRKCPTSYINPILPVIKPDGSIRLVEDAREINKRTIPEYDSPPKMDEILAQFRGKKYFSTTDITSSYWCVPIHIDDQKYTGFKYGNVTYVWCRAAFGLKNSGASLIRAVENILGADYNKGIWAFVDDIICAAETFDGHLKQLDYVLEKLKSAGFTLNLKKSRFGQLEIPFIGHILNNEGLKPNPDKMQAIQDFPTPKNLKNLRSFLGICNFYSKFCERYAEATEPLLELLRGKRIWKWEAKHDMAFSKIKEKFLKSIMLYHPDFSRKMYLQSDASDVGIGACLYQEDLEGKHEVLAFISRTLKGPERNYTVTEREALSIIWSLNRLRTMVLGMDLIIRTDHKALTFLKGCALTSGRLARWIVLLNEFDYTVEHIPGKDNFVPDLFSRNVEPPVRSLNAITAVPLKDVSQGLGRIANLQEVDRKLGPIYAWIKGVNIQNEKLRRRIIRVRRKFSLIDNVLHKRVAGVWKVCVPYSLQKDLAWHTHDVYCHTGSRKVYNILKEKFNWHNMSRDIEKMMKTCDLCQKNKFLNCTYDGIWKCIVPDMPNELLAVDIYGPLPKTKFGNKYLLVCVDVFSKFFQMFPLRKVTTQTCVRALERGYFTMAGKPKRILSDMGKQFTSRLWSQEMGRLGIEVVHTSIRHPQSNPSERYMREINRLFRMYTLDKHDDWFEVVPLINTVLNEIPHESTGCDAMSIHFGLKPERFYDTYFPGNREVDRINMIRHVKDALLKAGEKRLKWQHRKPHIFREGDSVLLRVPMLSDLARKKFSKFFSLYTGPHWITKDMGNNAFELTRANGVVVGVYNQHSLRPYLTPER